MKNKKKPIRTTPLPWEFPGALWIDEDEAALVNQVIQAKSPFRYYGPELQHMVDRLEKAFCKKNRVPYALAVNSGTAALYITFASFGIGPGDEVLIPGYLWVSCISTIVRLGAIPVLVDIDDSFSMCPIDLEKKITLRSKVILCVHMNGAAGRIDKIAQIARQHKLYLLEDCAQAAGCTFNNKPVGSFGDAAIFSFQLNKNMTSGEGGMILLQDKDRYNRCFAIHDLGYTRNEMGRLDTSNEQFQLWGAGARMSELTAAFALAQYNKLDRITKSMRDSKWYIRNRLATIKGLQFREIHSPEGDTGPFLITIYPSSEQCDAFTEQLNALGIKGHPGSLTCVTMKNWGLHWYFNNASLVNKRSLCADGFPWTHPKNAFAQSIHYHYGTLPKCDDLHNRSALLSIASTLTPNDCDEIIQAFQWVATNTLP